MFVRPLLDSDHADLAALVERVEASDGVEAFSEFKTMTMDRRAGRTVVADGPAGLVAVGHASWHHGDGNADAHWAIEVAIDPSVRSGEVWETMIAATVEQLPSGVLHVVWDRSGEWPEYAAALGYRAVRHLSTLIIDLPIDQRAELPPGVTVAAFVAGRDEDAWLAANNAAFRGHPENGGLTRADLAERMRRDWFREEDLLLAWQGAELVGSCWTKRHPDGVGEIYVIGVHPDHQRRSLGRALVLAGLTHLAEVAGCTKGMLYVDHRNEGAMRMYLGLGFTSIRITTMYRPAAEAHDGDPQPVDGE